MPQDNRPAKHDALEHMAHNAINTIRAFNRQTKTRIPSSDKNQISIIHQWLQVLVLPPKKAISTLETMDLAAVSPAMWGDLLSVTQRPDLTLAVSQKTNINWAAVLIPENEKNYGGSRYNLSHPKDSIPHPLICPPHAEKSWWVSSLMSYNVEHVNFLQDLLQQKILDPNALIPSPSLGGERVALYDIALIHLWPNVASIWKDVALDKSSACQSALAFAAMRTGFDIEQKREDFVKSVWDKISAQNISWVSPHPVPPSWKADLGWETNPALGVLVLSRWAQAHAKKNQQYGKKANQEGRAQLFQPPQWETEAISYIARQLADDVNVDQHLAMFAQAFLRTSPSPTVLGEQALHVLASRASHQAKASMMSQWIDRQLSPANLPIDVRYRVRQIAATPFLGGLLSADQSKEVIDHLVKHRPPLQMARHITPPAKPFDLTDLLANTDNINFWTSKIWGVFVDWMDPAVQVAARAHLDHLSDLAKDFANIHEPSKEQAQKIQTSILEWNAMKAFNWQTAPIAPSRKM